MSTLPQKKCIIIQPQQNRIVVVTISLVQATTAIVVTIHTTVAKKGKTHLSRIRPDRANIDHSLHAHFDYNVTVKKLWNGRLLR